MAEEDETQHRHGVFCRRQFGIGAEFVRGFPKFSFYQGNIDNLVEMKRIELSTFALRTRRSPN